MIHAIKIWYPVPFKDQRANNSKNNEEIKYEK